MKQEDNKYCIKHHHKDGQVCSYCEAIKLRDKKWVEEIEKMSSTYGTSARTMGEHDWQSLKSKMGVEDENT